MSNENLKTPIKEANISLNQTLTPIRFNESPPSKLSTNADSNIIICYNRLELILKTLQDNQQKWQMIQKRGVALCTSIEAIKTRCLDGNNTHYPIELKPYSDKLAVIVGMLSDISKSANESLRQLNALNKLNGSSNTIYYRTWTMPEYIKLLNEIVTRYREELKIKTLVMQELPNCTKRVDLIRLSCAWEYPQYTDEWLTLLFAFLKEEINVKKKS